MAEAARTRYAKCGDMDIAYQVLGDGPADLLMFPGPFVPIDSIDDEPSLYRFHRRLASFCRVIRFDHRGVGLSSRMLSMDTLGPKYWAEDAITVMDAWWDLAGNRAGPPTMARAVSKASRKATYGRRLEK